jgi:hypothetical protein
MKECEMIAIIILTIALLAVLSTIDDTHEKYYAFDAR